MHIPTVSVAYTKKKYIASLADQEDHRYISAFLLSSKTNKSGISRKVKILRPGRESTDTCHNHKK